MKYLIVGGVAGGATAAARIRRNTEDAEIIVFEKGPYISYANCGLPYYIGGIIEDRDKLFVQTPESFGKRFNADIRVRSEVIGIDPAVRKVRVRTAEGREYEESYDKLLLSPGAAPVVPPLPGIDSPGIFTLRNVQDTDRIKSYLREHPVRRAAIVGAGFIGLEMAESLRHTGIDVAIVEMADQVMAPLDYSMAAPVHEHLREKGVALYLGQAVSAFERQGERISLRFRSGRTLEADLVLLSIGVRPETGLAAAAGLEIGPMKGIRVNEYLQTSDEHIYAVGDAIEYPHPLTGQPWLNYLAGPANRQARIVADNLVFGNTVRYEGSLGTAVAKVFDLTAASTGLAAKRLKQMGIPYLSATVHSGAHAGYYPGALQLSLKITFSPADGKLYGAQAVGYDGVDKRIDSIAQVLKAGGSVYDLIRTEHAYAPPFSSAKDPAAVAGYVAGNILSGKMDPLYWRELRDADRSAVTLIDVRTAEEYGLGHIPGSVNIPVDEIRERLAEIPSDRPVWLYCGVGLRGYLASNILKSHGFKQVRNLIGGIRTFRSAVLPVCDPDSDSGSCQRQARELCPCPPDSGEAAPAPATGTADVSGTAGTPAVSRIDACGLQCPGPILRLKKGIDGLQPGSRLEITATDAGFPRDAESWCRTTGHRFLSSISENGIFRVQVEKRKENSGDVSPATAPAAVPATPAGGRGKTLILFSDDLDKALATFVLANGAAATGQPVTVFFTFWGLNVIKKEKKPRVGKDFFGRMFGWMLPADSRGLSLSKMNFWGAGARLMRHLMKRKGIDSLESLREQALQNGVEFIACQMSMDVMGIRREELLDQVTVGGVATYMDRADQANVNLFL